MISRSILVVTLAVLAACSHAPVQLSGTTKFVEHSPPRRTLATPATSRCSVALDSIEDQRKEPAKLGVILGRAIQAPEDTTTWIRQALATLAERGFAQAAAPAAGDPNVLLTSAVLKQFWVTDISTNKAANLVIDIQVRRAGRTVLEKSYRGSRTVANWATGQGEVQRLIDGTWSNALDQIAADLPTACEG